MVSLPEREDLVWEAAAKREQLCPLLASELPGTGLGGAGSVPGPSSPRNIRGTLHPLSCLCLLKKHTIMRPSDIASYVSVIPERHSLESGYLGLHPG